MISFVENIYPSVSRDNVYNQIIDLLFFSVNLIFFCFLPNDYFYVLVLNNFPSEEREFQLCTSMFQNMFPTINVAKEYFITVILTN